MLLLEAHAMSQFEHSNIVSLMGVTTLGTVHVMMEQCDTGSLLAFVKQEQCTVALKVALCLDVARGVAYMSGAGYAHPGLCARNVLLTATRVAKIAGFNHQQEFLSDAEYVRRCIPHMLHSRMMLSAGSTMGRIPTA